MKISTKAYLKKPDSKGESKICIHFSNNYKIDAISLNRTIHFSKFDSVNGYVKNTFLEASSINKVISSACSLLETIATDMVDSEFKLIKKNYLQHLTEQKQKDSGSLSSAEKIKAKIVIKERKKQRANLIIQNKIELLQLQIQRLLEKQEKLINPVFTNKSK